MAIKRKKPKVQKLCGWEVDDGTSHSLGIETWSNLQVQIHERHGKLKHVPEHATYKHLPKRRCPGFEDTDSFEKESLHEHFFRKSASTEKQRVSVESSQNSIVAQLNGSAPQKNARVVRIRTAGSVLSNDGERSKDDFDVPYKESSYAIQTLPRTDVPFGLTRAVTDLGEERSPTMRRMLYYSRKYASKDDSTFDEEEDEGYGSKTPSEEKEIKMFDTPFSNNQWGAATNGRYQQDFAQDNRAGARVAKFSYTHLASRPVAQGHFEDDPRNGVYHTDTHRKHRNHIQESRENIRTSKNLERSNTIMVNRSESEDRPSTIVLRKISIQNAQGEGTRETVFDLNKSLHRSYTTVHDPIQDRDHYSGSGSSPDVKCPQHRPQQKASNKITIDSSKLAPADVLKKTHAGIFDMQRSHTSVCMPIGELLPMADHFHIKSASSSTYPEPSPSIPNSARDQETPKLVNMDDASLDYYSINKSNTLCSGPFRQTKSSSQDTSTRKSVPHVDLYPHSASTLVPVPQETRTRITQSKPKEGLPSGSFLPKMPTLAVRRKRKPEKKPETTTLHVSISGVNIEIKQQFKEKLQRATTIGKIKLSTNPDRDTKKKLRDAFSRFYNKRSYGPNRNVNWSEDLRFVWNT